VSLVTRNVSMDIAVVDDGGRLLAFARMDGAKLSSEDIALPTRATGAGCTCSPRNKESGLYLQPAQ
jgi:uncharacterized protein GlcG (DUF336 family)